jgi:predicted metal-binding membrane protein
MAVVCGRPPAASDPLAIQLQWLGGWALMVLAMMLPPALPFLRAMSRVGASHRAAVVVLAAAAFAACWMAVGVALLAVAAGLSALVEQWPLLSARPALVSGLVAVAAGLFQFTPWKQACLVACRRPDGLILMAWRREAPRDAALRIGARYAAVCIGCCVPLMLLTIAVGAFALPLMVIVSVAMLFERTLPSVRALIPLQAALAVVIGLALLAGALPAGIGTAPPASLSLRGG